MAKNEVTKKENTAVAPMAMDYGADAAYADDSFGREDMAMPFLRALQSNSPQLKRQRAEFVEGAEEGMLYNTVTGKAFRADEGVLVTPVKYDRKFIEWIIREEGGGFVAEYSYAEGKDLLSTTTKDEKGRDILPNGHQLVDTMEYVVLYDDPDMGVMPAVFNLTSTQLKKGRNWNTLISSKEINIGDRTLKASRNEIMMCAFTYKLFTVGESNDKGDWTGYKIEDAGMTEHAFGENGADVYMTGRDLRVSVDDGERTVDYNRAGDTESPAGDAMDEEIPM